MNSTLNIPPESNWLPMLHDDFLPTPRPARLFDTLEGTETERLHGKLLKYSFNFIINYGMKGFRNYFSGYLTTGFIYK